MIGYLELQMIKNDERADGTYKCFVDDIRSGQPEYEYGRLF